MTEQQQAFYPQLPFVVLGAVDPGGDVWATIRAGRPGFLQTRDARRLDVAIPREPADPAENGMDDAAAIAVLGIEPATRRRNRLNGTIHRETSSGFAIRVTQSYGNCPRYITPRTPSFVRDPGEPALAPAMAARTFGARARAMISSADTFFVATYAGRAGGLREADVSHRGGPAGFVRIDDDGSLTIPDFAGNQFFNTLGNILVNPRAGLVFADFATGGLLQTTGRATIVAGDPETGAFPGAERLWRFTPSSVVFRAGALALRFSAS